MPVSYSGSGIELMTDSERTAVVLKEVFLAARIHLGRIRALGLRADAITNTTRGRPASTN